MKVWRDGDIVDADFALAATDRGWLIGDAAFETLLVEDSVPAFLDAHLRRLTLGLETLGISAAVEAAEVVDAIGRLSSVEMKDRAAARITVSRVGGARGLAESPQSRAQVVIALAPAPRPCDRFKIIVSDRRRSTLAGTNAFKCVGAYAENLLARRAAASAGADEAIMLNELGRVACASAANLFIVSDDALATPTFEEGAMPGVVRAVVLEEARRLGLKTDERPIDRAELAAGPVLLTNSIVGIIRTTLDKGERGAETPMVRSLITAYRRRLTNDLADRAAACDRKEK